jgi:hypothetical protein
MKSILRNTLTATLLVLSVSLNVFAANNEDIVDKVAPIEFKFVGLVNEQAVFELKVAATEAENDYVITVGDQTGTSFYKENVKSNQLFTKKFIFSEDINDNVLYVTVTCRNSNKSVVYKVENKYNYTQETVVNEVSNN